MKTRNRRILIQIFLLCAAMLATVVKAQITFTATTAQPADAPNTHETSSKKSEVIPWDQVGAKAGADYQGDGLSVAATEAGARLHCVFQRLDGEATAEGLWLVSMVTNQPGDRFRVVATAVGRQALAARGTVTVSGQSARFKRAGLVEEYSLSMDGVRQDFVVTEKPADGGQLEVQLAVSGARVEPAGYGAQLVLEPSGRKLAYSRLRATDANGKELPARIEVPQNSALGLTVVVNDAGAVYPVRIDPTFSDANWISVGGVPGTDRYGVVSVALADGLGNVYIGGDFTIVGSTVANCIAKWNGTSWSALGSGMRGVVAGSEPSVSALAMSGSTLYAGGYFTNAGGVAANYIAQWNGSSWSSVGSGMSYIVSALAVSGGTLYAGGGFNTAGGNGAYYIAQWNGTNWSDMQIGMDEPVYALAVSGGTLYAGGYFQSAGTRPANYIAAWNGSSWSALGSGMNSTVYALAVSGGTLYAGGFFTNAGGVAANSIARWNGSSWSALGSGMGGGDVYSIPYVDAITVSGGTLYAGGNFTTAGGTAANYIAKWNGSSWSALGPGMYLPGGGSTIVNALAVSGGTLFAGGFFRAAGGTEANNIAQWNGSSWSAMASGIGGGDVNGGVSVSAVAVAGGTLYVGGTFTTAGSNAANNIAQWNGSSWSALGSGLSGDTNFSGVDALAVSGGTLYAGGNFTNAGGVAANYIAKWNGSSWSALGPGMNNIVKALTVSGSTLYAGGNFTYTDDYATPLNYIAQWNGSSWTALGPGMGGVNFPLVSALAVSGNTLYAGGNFATAGGASATNIAQWNGSSWSSLGSGVGNLYPSVFSLAVSGSTLYAGGYFTTAGGTAANNIAQWNGSSWAPLGSGVLLPGNETVVSALAVSGGTLYAGGNFTTAGGTAVNYIAQWDGSSWSTLGSGVGGDGIVNVSALAVSGSTLYAGGDFTTTGGRVSAYVGEVYLVAPPGGMVDSIARPSSGTADVKCYGNPGQQFGVQRATHLAPPSWTNVSSSPLIPAADGSFTFVDTNAPAGAAFYRAFQY